MRYLTVRIQLVSDVKRTYSSQESGKLVVEISAPTTPMTKLMQVVMEVTAVAFLALHVKFSTTQQTSLTGKNASPSSALSSSSLPSLVGSHISNLRFDIK